MKTLSIALLILLLLAAGAALYLRATTPSSPAGVSFPLQVSQKELLESVPASAEVFALVPTAAAVHATLVTNAITRDAVETWSAERGLPRPWMIGAADLLVWRSGKETSYAMRVDPLRRLIVRTYLLASGGERMALRSGTLYINAQEGAPLGAASLAPFLSLANGLPGGDAFVVQRSGSRGAFPPLGRPAVSSIKVEPGQITVASRAGTEEVPSSPSASSSALTRKLPGKALLSGWFAQPPRVLADFDRLSLARISSIAGEGGMIILYDVNAGTLLPRPRGLLVVPATPETTEAAGRLKGVAEAVGEIREENGLIQLAFDRSSLGSYATDVFDDPPWPSTEWAVLMDVQRMLPILHRLGDSTGLRFAAPRIHRSARDLRRWMEVFREARTIEAGLSRTPGVEELRVRITSK